MNKNPVRLLTMAFLVFAPLLFGCDSYRQVGLKIPLNVMPSTQENGPVLDETEVLALSKLMENYADEEKFAYVEEKTNKPDYYYQSYGPWFRNLTYIIDKKAGTIAIRHFQAAPGPSVPPGFENSREFLIRYMQEKFDDHIISIDPDNCSSKNVKKFKLKIHDRKGFLGLWQWKENPEYRVVLGILNDELREYSHLTSYTYFEPWEGRVSYSFGRITGYHPAERQIEIELSGGNTAKYLTVEMLTTVCPDQILDNIDTTVFYNSLVSALKIEFGDDAIKELKVK